MAGDGVARDDQRDHEPRADVARRKAAAAPCGIISFDGITLVFAAAVVPTSDLVAGLLLLLGVTMFIVFFLLSLCVGWFRRPRFLLPKSMRPG